ncbi:hypothetical protein JTB14_026298 [Gonioctena quinquepunctata]|nr:hypothetical protein JTB14_026298 [Gonioctena quinquepunctata]
MESLCLASPRTSLRLHPLDICFYGPLKKAYGQEKQKKKERKRNRQPGKSSKAKEEKIRNVTKKVKFDDRSSEESDISMTEICDDDSLDDLEYIQDTDNNVCALCGEFSRGRELWFRCVNCAEWVHAECSGANSAVGYKCDNCD